MVHFLNGSNQAGRVLARFDVMFASLCSASIYQVAPSPSHIDLLTQTVRVRCHTAGYLSFGPMAQCVVHALKGLACRAHVTPASSPASHCKQCSALTSPSPHVRGCASPSRALAEVTENIIYFSMGPKLRYPTEGLVCAKFVLWLLACSYSCGRR